jgi:hypothetical protein
VVGTMNNIKPSKLGGWRKRNCSNVSMEKKVGRKKTSIHYKGKRCWKDK